MNATVDPAEASFLAFRLSFIESNKFSSTVAFICSVYIALTSHHLYSNARIGRMPFFASVCWWLSSLFFGLKLFGNRSPVALYVFGPISWSTDYVSRSLVLWFTYYRTVSVWQDKPELWYLVVSLQVLSLGPLGYGLYVTAPNGPVMTSSKEYDFGASLYAATDLFASVFDCVLLYRLYVLNQTLQQSILHIELVKPRFFYMSIVCLCCILALSVLKITVFATGNDPYWSWYTIFFAFRIFLTDVFSNLLRDSLIEAKIKEHSQTGTTKNSASVAPPSSPAHPSSSQSTSAARFGVGCR